MKIHRNTGFTLLEILVSVGILATVAVLITQVLFVTTHVNKKTELMGDIQQNGNFTIDVIGRLARGASADETVCDVGETSTQAALFRNPDNKLTTILCRSDGNVARIASVSGTGKVAYLSGSTLTLSTSGGATCADSSLTFSCPSATSALTVSFSLGQPGTPGGPYEQARSSFQSTITVRN